MADDSPWANVFNLTHPPILHEVEIMRGGHSLRIKNWLPGKHKQPIKQYDECNYYSAA